MKALKSIQYDCFFYVSNVNFVLCNSILQLLLCGGADNCLHMFNTLQALAASTPSSTEEIEKGASSD